MSATDGNIFHVEVTESVLQKVKKVECPVFDNALKASKYPGMPSSFVEFKHTRAKNMMIEDRIIDLIEHLWNREEQVAKSLDGWTFEIPSLEERFANFVPSKLYEKCPEHLVNYSKEIIMQASNDVVQYKPPFVLKSKRMKRSVYLGSRLFTNFILLLTEMASESLSYGRIIESTAYIVVANFLIEHLEERAPDLIKETLLMVNHFLLVLCDEVCAMYFQNDHSDNCQCFSSYDEAMGNYKQKLKKVAYCIVIYNGGSISTKTNSDEHAFGELEKLLDGKFFLDSFILNNLKFKKDEIFGKFHRRTYVWNNMLLIKKLMRDIVDPKKLDIDVFEDYALELWNITEFIKKESVIEVKWLKMIEKDYVQILCLISLYGSHKERINSPKRLVLADINFEDNASLEFQQKSFIELKCNSSLKATVCFPSFTREVWPFNLHTALEMLQFKEAEPCDETDTVEKLIVLYFRETLLRLPLKKGSIVSLGSIRDRFDSYCDIISKRIRDKESVLCHCLEVLLDSLQCVAFQETQGDFLLRAAFKMERARRALLCFELLEVYVHGKMHSKFMKDMRNKENENTSTKVNKITYHKGRFTVTDSVQIEPLSSVEGIDITTEDKETNDSENGVFPKGNIAACGKEKDGNSSDDSEENSLLVKRVELMYSWPLELPDLMAENLRKIPSVAIQELIRLKRHMEDFSGMKEKCLENPKCLGSAISRVYNYIKTKESCKMDNVEKMESLVDLVPELRKDLGIGRSSCVGVSYLPPPV